jgi:hypothetical protein
MFVMSVGSNPNSAEAPPQGTDFACGKRRSSFCQNGKRELPVNAQNA